MASISLRILRDNGTSITSSVTIADTDITRIINALSASTGMTPQAVVDKGLSMTVNRWVSATTTYEGKNSTPPIPVS